MPTTLLCLVRWPIITSESWRSNSSNLSIIGSLPNESVEQSPELASLLFIDDGYPREKYAKWRFFSYRERMLFASDSENQNYHQDYDWWLDFCLLGCPTSKHPSQSRSKMKKIFEEELWMKMKLSKHWKQWIWHHLLKSLNYDGFLS